MIIDKITNWRRYEALAELRTAFEFLEGQTEVCLAGGRVEIEGDNVFAIIQSYTTKPLAESRFESHQRYADIHFLSRGAEMLGYAPVDTLAEEIPYDPEKDLAFHPKPEQFTLTLLPAGYFAVCYPEDGHMPGCAAEAPAEVTKIVMKIKVV
jgi:YhcH/YjgK/YiaL family protein